MNSMHPTPHAPSENMRDWIQDNDIPWVEITSVITHQKSSLVNAGIPNEDSNSIPLQ